jgi:UDP-N-acetylmuramate dehydrogenase
MDPEASGGRGTDVTGDPFREYATRLEKVLGVRGPEVRLGEPLRAHTTLQIGGPADAWVEARTAEAVTTALATAHEMHLPVLVVGGGSNLLASDSGWRGVAVHVAGSRTAFADGECTVEAGADFLGFIFACRDRSLTALEFAAGIPGSIGGAIYGNAGCYGKSIGDFVIAGEVCRPDGSGRRWEPAEFFEFAYRDSRLKREPHVVVAVRLRLAPGSLEAIQAEIDLRLGERKVKHPDWRTEPTAGSYFKNLPPESPGEHRVPAGKVLDQLDCRGLRVGDALVFHKHANIIVNAGRASAREVLTLAEVMRTRALRTLGVRLEEEVMFVGERPSLLPHAELSEGT